jgi:hypothetical protein
MATYILTWNPRRWHWDEGDFNGKVERTRQGELVPDRWSCGNTKRIVVRDRLFPLRQGVDRGLVGSSPTVCNFQSGWSRTTPPTSVTKEFQPWGSSCLKRNRDESRCFGTWSIASRRPTASKAALTATASQPIIGTFRES